MEQSIYDGIINYIYDLESKNNPFYKINTDIKIHKCQSGEFNYSVGYSVEYMSCRPDGFPIWKKWNTKDIRIDKDGADFLSCVRDSKIDSVLKSNDN